MSDGDRSIESNPRVLVGREVQLTELTALVRQFATVGGARLLVGDPGVGKTALLEVAAREAAAAGQLVLRASVAESETDVNFAGVNALIMPLAASVRELPATHRDALLAGLGLSDVSPSSGPIVVDALLALLELTPAPPLLVVDDVSWLDQASALALGSLARRMVGTRIGFLATARTGSAGSFDHTTMTSFEVPPLTDAASNELLHRDYPGLAPSVIRRVVKESAGLPLALRELPSALSVAQRMGHDSLPAVLPLSRRLQTIWNAQIHALPDAERRLLLLAALAGQGPVAVPDASTAAEFVSAQQARLITLDASGQQLVFAHPLVRSAIVALSTISERLVAHSALAARSGTDPDTQAYHLSHATIRPDEHVASLIEQLAFRLLAQAEAVTAVSALQRAAQLSPRASDRSRRLAQAAYIGSAVSGTLDRADGLLAQARLAEVEAGAGQSLAVATASAYLTLHRIGDVNAAADALAAAGSMKPAAGDAFSAQEYLRTLLEVAHLARREELWPSSGAAVAQLSRGRPELAIAVVTFGDPRRSDTALLDELAVLIWSLDTESDHQRILGIAMAACFVDRLSACRLALQRVVADGTDGTATTASVTAMLYLADESFRRGDWASCARLADEAASAAKSLGHVPLYQAARRHHLMLAAGRGERDAVDRLCTELKAWSVPGGAIGVKTWIRMARGRQALGHGDYENAYVQLSRISPPGQLLPHEPYALETTMDLTEAAVKSGRRTDAADHAKAVAAAGTAAISPRQALLCAAAAALSAPPETARSFFEEALELGDPTQWVFDRARVELCFGEHLRRARATTEARVHLVLAFTVFERLGATPWADRATVELRATSMTRQQDKASMLTAQEREIALLAATGLTNRQIAARLFISPRTVGAHLYRVFPKLGVSSRSGLRDVLADETPSGTPGDNVTE